MDAKKERRRVSDRNSPSLSSCEKKEPEVRLKTGIDLCDLRKQKGVVFELEDGCKSQKSKFGFEKPSPEEMYSLPISDLMLGDEEDEEESLFERLPKEMVDITKNKDGGVLKKLITEGSGGKIPRGALVRVNYSGFFEHSIEALILPT